MEINQPIWPRARYLVYLHSSPGRKTLECCPARSCQMSHFSLLASKIGSPHPGPMVEMRRLRWLEPRVRRQQTPLFIHMSALSFLDLRSLSFQPHLKTSSLRFLLRSLVFQFFRLLGPPPLQLHLPRGFWSYFMLIPPSGHSFSVRPSEVLSLTHHPKLFCTLVSLQCSVLSSPDPVVAYIILLWFTTALLGPAPNPTHSRYAVNTSARHKGCPQMPSCVLFKESLETSRRSWTYI